MKGNNIALKQKSGDLLQDLVADTFSAFGSFNIKFVYECVSPAELNGIAVTNRNITDEAVQFSDQPYYYKNVLHRSC